MSITDELRTWMYGHTVNCSDDRIALVAIADRIDAEHQKATAGCIHYDPERHYCAVHGDTEHGWVRLPVDADGVPIHVGDEMCNTHKDGFMAKRVTGLCVHSSGRWTVEVDEARLRWHDADKLHHYTPPTVEDVLRAMIDELFVDVYADPDTIAEYAAKLRLAGEDE